VSTPAHARAKPPVRRLARDLGVDLGAVAGTGPDGTITREDVLAVGEPGDGGSAPVSSLHLVSGPAERGDRREPIRGVRKSMAAAMVSSAFTAPHVTIFYTVDVTESVALVEQLRALPEFTGVKVTPLLLVARALLRACRMHPEVNASWDDAAQEIVVHGRVNLGIAAATPRGLVVPNIKDADVLPLVGLAQAIEALTSTAREGRATPADLRGGTITITNIGVFGVDTGTPILNPGEAAILCAGAIRQQPWVHAAELAVRDVMQLSLSVDHRLIDGALASQVLAAVGAGLEQPLRLLLDS
jgi:pyruvate dehydrogenase E2 component (dihydrolipoamide acetyltransferase)